MIPEQREQEIAQGTVGLRSTIINHYATMAKGPNNTMNMPCVNERHVQN